MQIWYAVGADNTITSKTTAAWTDFYVIPITVRSPRSPFSLNRHLIRPLKAMYPTLVMMIVTMQDSVLAANSDNLPNSRASSFRFAMPSRDAESRISSEGRLPPSPPGLRRTLFTEAIEDEKNMDEKGFDTVCRVETAHLRCD